MKVNTILLMILVLIVVPLVVAQPTYQQNTIIDLTVPCTNNGSTCSGTATCEAMVINSDGLIIVNNESMTKNIGFFSYTVPSVNTSILGDYEFTVCCKDAGQTKCKTLPFGVTPSGFTGTLGFFIIILLLSAGVIVLGFAIKDAPITILGSFGLYFLGIYIMFYGMAGIKDGVTTFALSIIILGLAAYISIRSAYELIVD